MSTASEGHGDSLVQTRNSNTTIGKRCIINTWQLDVRVNCHSADWLDSIATRGIRSCEQSGMESIPPVYSRATEGQCERQYAPPWADLSIIGIAGSSGSGKTSVAMEIVKSLNLPWVVILVMVLLLIPLKKHRGEEEKKAPRPWHLMLYVYRIHSTRAYLLKSTPKHMQINMTLTVQMHWILMWWCRHWKTWNEGIVYLSSWMHRYSASPADGRSDE